MDPEDEHRALCQPIVKKLISHYDWRLLSEDEFITAVLERAPAQDVTDPGALRRWCINTYCVQALYPACNGEQGDVRRQRGFVELAEYLHRLAVRNWPDVAGDAAQDAIVRVYDTIGDCRHPGAFLAFAMQKLSDAATKQRKAEARKGLLENDLDGDIASGGPSPEGAMLRADLEREIAEMIKEAEKRYPKARRQLEALQRHLNEWSTEEIAAAMKTSAQNVLVLLSRARKKLREDPELRERAEEILRR